MLIIAIPKSASSSLMATLGELHNLPATQIFFPELPVPKTLNALWRYHSDVREINSTIAKAFAEKTQIHKQHLPPTPNNRNLLKNCRKVILLRNPEDIVRAYRRARRRLISKPLEGFSIFRSEHDWLKRAKENGLFHDLESFIEEWPQGKDDDKLIIWYEELIKNPKRVINAIESFWDLPITQHDISLTQKRYSRTSRATIIHLMIRLLHFLGLFGIARKLYRKYIKHLLT